MTSVKSGTALGKTQRLADKTPISNLDPYSDQALIDPWPTYIALQDAGPAVWLSKYKMFALTRYDSALKALQNPSSFPSSLGVMMNDHMNQVLRGNTLCSDGEDHSRLRRVIVDSGARIPESSSIGFDANADRAAGYTVTDSGIVVVPSQEYQVAHPHTFRAG